MRKNKEGGDEEGKKKDESSDDDDDDDDDDEDDFGQGLAGGVRVKELGSGNNSFNMNSDENDSSEDEKDQLDAKDVKVQINDEEGKLAELNKQLEEKQKADARKKGEDPMTLFSDGFVISKSDLVELNCLPVHKHEEEKRRQKRVDELNE